MKQKEFNKLVIEYLESNGGEIYTHYEHEIYPRIKLETSHGVYIFKLNDHNIARDYYCYISFQVKHPLLNRSFNYNETRFNTSKRNVTPELALEELKKVLI
jgi:hypothetical protein